MGLTVHYDIRSEHRTARGLVERMRQLALDLPFEEVGELLDLQGAACDFQRLPRPEPGQAEDDARDCLRWLLIQATAHVPLPWAPPRSHIGVDVPPQRCLAFSVWPGPGCEPANIGLCGYPQTIPIRYRPQDDRRFRATVRQGSWSSEQFSWAKWQRYARRHGLHAPEAREEMRALPTKLARWSWGSFCKTQYASDADCGGAANFLRCHISLITLLERIGQLPGVRVRVCDEGNYGAHTTSLDWQEATQSGRKPTYRRCRGTHSPAELLRQVGDYNRLVAGLVGGLKDLLPQGQAVAPILDYPNFEQLEFQSSQNESLQQFLGALAESARGFKERTLT